MKKITLHYIRKMQVDMWGGTEEACIRTLNSISKEFIPIIVTNKILKDESVNQNVRSIPLKKFQFIYPYFGITKDHKRLMNNKGGNPLSFSLIFYALFLKNLSSIHIHSLGFNAFFLFLVAKIRNIPFIVSLHGGFKDVSKGEQEYFRLLYKNLRCIFGPFRKYMTDERLISGATKVICVGKQEYEKLSAEGLNNHVYIPNGVKVSDFIGRTKKPETKQFSKFFSKKYILSVGRIDPQKDQLSTIKGFRKWSQENPGYNLILVGSITNQKYNSHLKNYIKKHNLKNVYLIGQLKANSRELKWLYQNAYCLIQTSRHEPFGITIIEAMSARCPVITNKTGGMSRIFQDNIEGLYLSNVSEKEIVSKLDEIKKYSHELTKNAFDLVLRKYDLKIINEQIYNIYKGVSV